MILGFEEGTDGQKSQWWIGLHDLTLFGIICEEITVGQ
jgi:hypothetical protein